MPQNQFLDYGRQQARSLALLAQQGAQYRGLQLQADLASARMKQREAEQLGAGLSQIGAAMQDFGQRQARRKALDEYFGSEYFQGLEPGEQARQRAQGKFAEMGDTAPGFVGQVGFEEQLALEARRARQGITLDIERVERMGPAELARQTQQYRKMTELKMEYLPRLAKLETAAQREQLIMELPLRTAAKARLLNLGAGFDERTRRNLLQQEFENAEKMHMLTRETFFEKYAHQQEAQLGKMTQAQLGTLRGRIQSIQNSDAREEEKAAAIEPLQDEINDLLIGELSSLSDPIIRELPGGGRMRWDPNAGLNGDWVEMKSMSEDDKMMAEQVKIYQIATALAAPGATFKELEEIAEGIATGVRNRVELNKNRNKMLADEAFMEQTSQRSGPLADVIEEEASYSAGVRGAVPIEQTPGTLPARPAPSAPTVESAEQEYRAFAEGKLWGGLNTPEGRRMFSEWKNKVPTADEYALANQILAAGKAASKDSRKWAEHVYERYNSQQVQNVEKAGRGEPITIRPDEDPTPYIGQTVIIEGRGRRRISRHPVTGQTVIDVVEE